VRGRYLLECLPEYLMRLQKLYTPLVLWLPRSLEESA
jgi:hypothetical protein